MNETARESLDQKVRKLLGKSIKFEVKDGSQKSLSDLETALLDTKSKLKTLNKLYRSKSLSLSQTIERKIALYNLRQIENSILYRQEQLKQSTNGPISITEMMKR